MWIIIGWFSISFVAAIAFGIFVERSRRTEVGPVKTGNRLNPVNSLDS